jgi:hypothetical protein
MTMGSWAHLSWSVVNIGVGIMIGLFIAAFALNRPGPPGPGALPAPPPTPAPTVGWRPFVPPADVPTGPTPVPPTVTSGAGSRTAVHPGGAGRETTQPARPAPRSDVTGRYRLMNSYVDSFIGEVLLTNAAAAPRTWTVTLRFPATVGGLRTAWVESAPQATLRRSGPTLTFTGTAPLAARSSVPLRFHFDRTGPDVRPAFCAVDGAPCR